MFELLIGNIDMLMFVFRFYGVIYLGVIYIKWLFLDKFVLFCSVDFLNVRGFIWVS